MPFTYPFVVRGVLGQDSRLFHLPKKEIVQCPFTFGVQCEQRVTVEVSQYVVPLLQEVKHSVVTAPCQLGKVTQPVHLADVVLGPKVVVVHPRHLETRDEGVPLPRFVFFLPDLLVEVRG